MGIVLIGKQKEAKIHYITAFHQRNLIARPPNKPDDMT